MSERGAAHEMIKAIYEDGEAELTSGRVYKFSRMVHKERRKVFAFYTSIQEAAGRNDFSFLESDAFAAVEKIIENRVLFEGSALSKRATHWDEYPDDYVQLIMIALGVISYPFLSGAPTS